MSTRNRKLKRRGASVGTEFDQLRFELARLKEDQATLKKTMAEMYRLLEGAVSGMERLNRQLGGIKWQP